MRLSTALAREMIHWIGLLAIAACGERGEPAGPPDLVLGLDICSSCGMTIDDPRYAAALVSGDSMPQRFDDIGCLLSVLVVGSATEGHGVWLHDHLSTEWLRASEAWLAKVDGLATPMASGLAAFASRSDADSLAASRGGRVMSWTQATLRASQAARGAAGEWTGVGDGAEKVE